jgi:hypothetical protein
MTIEVVITIVAVTKLDNKIIQRRNTNSAAQASEDSSERAA